MDIVSSWVGICPGNNRSAGKNRSNRPTGGNRWLRGALTECAWAAAAKKNCFSKAKFWRITSQISREEELRASSCGSHHHATGLRGPPHRTTIPPGPGPLGPTEGPLDPPPRPQIGQTWRSEFIGSAPALVPKRHYRRTDRNREKSVFSEENLSDVSFRQKCVTGRGSRGGSGGSV